MEKPDYSYPLACMFPLAPEGDVPEQCMQIRVAAASAAEYLYQEFGLRLTGIRIDDVRSDSLDTSEEPSGEASVSDSMLSPDWVVILMVEVPGQYDPGVLLETGAMASPDSVLNLLYSKFFDNLKDLDAHLVEMTVASVRAHVQGDVMFVVTP